MDETSVGVPGVVKAVSRRAANVASVLLVATVGLCMPCWSQANANANLQTYFKQDIGLTDSEVASIRAGKAYAKALPSRIPDEVFVFGAVYVKARPAAYVKLFRDFDRLSHTSGFLALRAFSSPPRLSDLEGFGFDAEDIKDLQKCKPGDCDVQAPTEYIEDFRQKFDWSSPQVGEQINTALRQTALERLLAYQREGNRALGVYHDKKHPADVAQQFEYMLSYLKALPRYLPDFHNYLLRNPQGRPPNTEDSFYWAKVKFGLKPTLRVVHVITMKMREGASADPSYAIAEKQLYASHYFRSALDLTFCISDGEGFYLIKILGSEQTGLSGIKGSVIRNVAVGKSTSGLKDSLTSIKNTLERLP